MVWYFVGIGIAVKFLALGIIVLAIGIRTISHGTAVDALVRIIGGMGIGFGSIWAGRFLWKKIKQRKALLSRD